MTVIDDETWRQHMDAALGHLGCSFADLGIDLADVEQFDYDPNGQRGPTVHIHVPGRILRVEQLIPSGYRVMEATP